MKVLLIALLPLLLAIPAFAQEAHTVLGDDGVERGTIFGDFVRPSSIYSDPDGAIDILGTRRVLSPHISGRGLVAFYSPGGCDPTLNPGCRWWTPARNHLVCSEDLTCTWAETGLGTINDATHFTFAAQNDALHQSVTTTSGVEYTHCLTTGTVGGNADLQFYHSGLASASTAQTFASSTSYCNTVTGDGGAVLFGIQDQNAGGFGQIEITKSMVTTGTRDTDWFNSYCEKVGADRDTIINWRSPGTNDATNNGANLVSPSSRNLLAAGSTTTLDHDGVNWSANLTPTITTGQADPLGGSEASKFETNALSEGIFALAANRPTVQGDVTLSVWLKGESGGEVVNTRTEHVDGNVNTEKTLTTSWARYSVTRTSLSSGALTVAIYSNTASAQTFYVAHPQVEIGSTTSTYTNPAEESVVKGGEFTTDDYATADGIASGFSGEDKPATVVMLFRADDATLNDLFSFGRSTQNTPLWRLSVSTTLRFQIQDNTATNKVRTTTETINVGQWHIFALTKTGTTIAGYLDGNAVTWDDADVDVGSVTVDQATIGALGRIGYSAYFEGGIGPVPVWDRALSAGEILRASNQIAKQACIHRGIAEMCTVANRTAPAIGKFWGGATWLLALNPAVHAEQRIIEVGRQVDAVRRWEAAR